MDGYIKSIVVFNAKGERRKIDFCRGVNIISGESKTGKSALLEIVDYCLCSTRCSIPKGVITNFAFLYSLFMEVNNKIYAIARTSWESSDSRPMFFSVEDAEFNIDNIDIDYFNFEKKVSVQEAKRLIESALGLDVNNVSVEPTESGRRISLRNMVPYLFQHQNLIASKFALFYRFSDYYKRKDTIDQFPVFAGMIGQEYHSLLLERNSLKSQLRQKERQNRINQKSETYVRDNLLALLKDYCSLLNLDFNEMFRSYSTETDVNTRQVFNIASNLPALDESALLESDGIIRRYEELNKELELLRDQEQKLLLRISDIEKATSTGALFSRALKELDQQSHYAKIRTNNYSCPLCGHECPEISAKDEELISAVDRLHREIRITQKYTSSFSDDLRKLKSEKVAIASKIRSVYSQIHRIEREYISSGGLRQVREQIYAAKAKIDLYVNLNQSGLFSSTDEEIEDLKEKINHLTEAIGGFDLDSKLRRAESSISENMTRIANSLDFESEYSPLDLNFNLINETFDVYQRQGNHSKIFLSEMGSGANWVSCHISLFLSMLRFFATQKQSHVPPILFFDQPSQVYFPRGVDDIQKASQSDLDAVDRLYKTIFDEVDLIQKDTNILPQIIIVDHVDGSDLLHGKEFKSHVRYNWYNGKALI